MSTARRRPARMPKRLLRLRSDELVCARAAAGDEGAFEVLYERHVGGVLSFCRHMLGSLEEAEDAAQHSFAALHGELVRGAGDLHLRPWLYAVARNRCLSTLRARRERPDDALDPQTAGLTDELERRADLRELLGDLHDLPTDQRAALVLSELGDLSQVEVGEVLGTGTAQVKGLVFRARSGLIERREARAASCVEIRAELASARKGAFRRGRLRHHLRACPDCGAYLAELRRQRRMMALLLPVVPSVGLKRGIFTAAGLGTGAGAGSVALSKVVIVGAVAGTAAVAGGTAAELSGRDGGARAGASDGRDAAPEVRRAGVPGASGGAGRPARRGSSGGASDPSRAGERATGRPGGGGDASAGARGGRNAGSVNPDPQGRGAPSAEPPGRAMGRGAGRGATSAPGSRSNGRGSLPRSERPGRRVGQAPAGVVPGEPPRSQGAPGASEGRGPERVPSGDRSQQPGHSGSQRLDEGGSQPPDGGSSGRPGAPTDGAPARDGA